GCRCQSRILARPEHIAGFAHPALRLLLDNEALRFAQENNACARSTPWILLAPERHFAFGNRCSPQRNTLARRQPLLPPGISDGGFTILPKPLSGYRISALVPNYRTGRQHRLISSALP